MMRKTAISLVGAIALAATAPVPMTAFAGVPTLPKPALKCRAGFTKTSVTKTIGGKSVTLNKCARDPLPKTQVKCVNKKTPTGKTSYATLVTRTLKNGKTTQKCKYSVTKPLPKVCRIGFTNVNGVCVKGAGV